MLSVEKWAANYHPLIAAGAIEQAKMLDPIYEVCQQLKDRTVIGHHFQISDLSTWFELYQSQEKVLQAIIPTLSMGRSTTGASPEIGQNIVSMAQLFMSRPNDGKAEPLPIEIQEEANRLFKEMLSVTITDYKNNLSGQHIDCSESKEMADYFKSNEMELAFFLLIVIPCLVHYQTLPRILYQQGLNGDVNALEKLLRLDRRLLHDSSIGKQLDIIHSKSLTDYNKLVKDSLELPKPKVTRQRMLYALAGFISASTMMMGHTLEEPAIRELFDSVSRDRHGEDDVDIPDFPDSFYQSIRRSREKWLEFFQSMLPDKNS